MSIRILTTRTNGQKSNDLYETEAQGLKLLENNLNTHRAAGHTVTQEGNVFTVTDRNGTFVQRSEIVRSV